MKIILNSILIHINVMKFEVQRIVCGDNYKVEWSLIS